MSGSGRPDAPGSRTDPEESISVPIVEETARVDKRSVETGRVRVMTRTDTVEEVVAAKLASQDYEVTRVAIGRELVSEPVPVLRQEGELTIIPVLEEVLVVEKRLVLKEELHIRRRVTTDDVEVPITLRRQRAVIDRVAADDPTDTGDVT